MNRSWSDIREEAPRPGLPPVEEMTAFARIQAVAVRHFQFNAFELTDRGARFEVAGWFTSPEAFDAALKPLGFGARLKKRRKVLSCYVVPLDEIERAERRSARIAVAMLLATIGTTLYAGHRYSLDIHMQNPLFGAACFSFGIIFILGAHELAHKIAAKRRGIAASPPFFIPMPPPFLLGTMGAVIRLKGRAPDRESAIELGASGPIVSFFASIPFIWIGLILSARMPAPGADDDLIFGSSILIQLIWKAALAGVSPAQGLTMHPILFAGWIGLFVTCLNLIPIGQLDGGHVARAILGRKIFPWVAGVCALALIGLTAISPVWFAWAIIGLVFLRIGNPGSTYERRPVSWRHVGAAIFCLIMLALTFMPAPIMILDAMP